MYKVVVHFKSKKEIKGINEIETYHKARNIAYQNLLLNTDIKQVSIFDTSTKTMVENIVRSFPEAL